MPEGVVHHPAALINVSNKYRNDAYIATEVFPAVSVVKESDRITTYGYDTLRLPETRRANGAASRRATFSYSYTSYNLQFHSISDSVTQRDRDNADAPIDPDVDVTEFLTDTILLRREVSTAEVAFTTGTWSAYTSVATANSWVLNTTASDPIVDVNSATAAIMLNSGKRANRAVMGYLTFLAAKDHSQITERIKYTERAIVTADMLAALFDLDKVVIGTAVRNTGAEGIANSNTSVWSRDCLVYYVPPSPGKRVASAGYMLNKGAQPFRVKRWHEEAIDGDIIEVSSDFSPEALGTSCAYLIEGADRT